MFSKAAILTACLGLTVAAPVAELAERQMPEYPDNGTLVNPPNVTTLTRPNPEYTTDQLNQVKLTYTMVERLALINSFGDPNDYFKFDLTPNGSHSNAANGLGGQGYLAHVGNYPVLMGTGISVAIGYLNPCGLDSIHVHNRATEMVILVAGTSLKTGFVLEDGFGKSLFLGKFAKADTAQIFLFTPKLAYTKVPSVHKALSIGSLTTIASLQSLLLRSPMKIPESLEQLKISSSTHKRS